MHNHVLHNTNQPYDILQLQTMVQQIFHKAEQHPDTLVTIRNQTVKTILACPISSIVSWAQCSAMHLRDHATATALRAKLNTTDIWTFFQVRLQPQPAQPPPPPTRQYDPYKMTLELISMCDPPLP